jgi:hypothetical protein
MAYVSIITSSRENGDTERGQGGVRVNGCAGGEIGCDGCGKMWERVQDKTEGGMKNHDTKQLRKRMSSKMYRAIKFLHYCTQE